MNSTVLTTWCVVVVAFALFNVLSAHGSDDEGHIFYNYGVCPRRRAGVRGTCVELCSNDRDCPDGAKCCSNGCGHVCTKAYIEKPGVCPMRYGPPSGSCSITCWDDSACPGNKKCCYNGCGHMCMNP